MLGPWSPHPSPPASSPSAWSCRGAAPAAAHLRAGFPVTRRLTVRQQTANGVPDQTRDAAEDEPRRAPVVRNVDRLHG
jgi:hypothetical protein